MRLVLRFDPERFAKAEEQPKLFGPIVNNPELVREKRVDKHGHVVTRHVRPEEPKQVEPPAAQPVEPSPVRLAVSMPTEGKTKTKKPAPLGPEDARRLPGTLWNSRDGTKHRYYFRDYNGTYWNLDTNRLNGSQGDEVKQAMLLAREAAERQAALDTTPISRWQAEHHESGRVVISPDPNANWDDIVNAYSSLDPEDQPADPVEHTAKQIEQRSWGEITEGDVRKLVERTVNQLRVKRAARDARLLPGREWTRGSDARYYFNDFLDNYLDLETGTLRGRDSARVEQAIAAARQKAAAAAAARRAEEVPDARFTMSPSNAVVIAPDADLSDLMAIIGDAYGDAVADPPNLVAGILTRALLDREITPEQAPSVLTRAWVKDVVQSDVQKNLRYDARRDAERLPGRQWIKPGGGEKRYYFTDFDSTYLEWNTGKVVGPRAAEARAAMVDAHTNPPAPKPVESGPAKPLRVAYPVSDHPQLNKPMKFRPDGPVYVPTGTGKTWRVSDDDPSMHSRLLGHEGEQAHYVYFREATPDEVVAYEAERAEAARRQRVAQHTDAVKRRIMKEGEKPRGEPRFVLDGERLLDTGNIYGGGDWFVLMPESIWYVRNNGMDGDTWDANNVRTGGAGAIGWRVPRTPGLEQELRALARGELPSLEPPAA